MLQLAQQRLKVKINPCCVPIQQRPQPFEVLIIFQEYLQKETTAEYPLEAPHEQDKPAQTSQPFPQLNQPADFPGRTIEGEAASHPRELY